MKVAIELMRRVPVLAVTPLLLAAASSAPAAAGTPSPATGAPFHLRVEGLLEATVAVGETVILLHPPLPLVGVSI